MLSLDQIMLQMNGLPEDSFTGRVTKETIMSFVKSRKETTPDDLMEHTGLSHSSASKRLQYLSKKGDLKMEMRKVTVNGTVTRRAYYSC